MNTALAIGLFLVAFSMTRGVLRSIRTVAKLPVALPDPAAFAGGVVLVAAEVVVLVLAGMRLL